MSKSESPREWHFYVSDMLEFADKAQAYTEGFTQTQFVADGLTYDATLRNLELMGEAATHVPEPVRTEFGDVPWRLIVATRNKLIHAYLGVDDDTVWSVIRDDLPALVPVLRRILDEGTSGGSSAT